VKRFLAFKGDECYPCQGMEDFVGDFDTLESAVDALTVTHKTQTAWRADSMWAVVWDSECRSDAWDHRALPES